MNNEFALHFTPATLRLETKVNVVCPCCNKHSWSVNHLFSGLARALEGFTKVKWTCPECYHDISIRVYSQDRIEVADLGPVENPMISAVVLLRSDHEKHPIYAMVETRHLKDAVLEAQESVEDNSLQYYYNHGTCPTNWTSRITALAQDGEDDPHGCFKFVTVLSAHQAKSYLEKQPNVDWYREREDDKTTAIRLSKGMRALFPQVFTEKGSGDADTMMRERYAEALLPEPLVKE